MIAIALFQRVSSEHGVDTLAQKFNRSTNSFMTYLYRDLRPHNRLTCPPKSAERSINSLWLVTDSRRRTTCTSLP